MMRMKAMSKMRQTMWQNRKHWIVDFGYS
jgi:hypothetical protein